PIEFCNLPPVAAAARHDCAGVLLRSHYPIWILIVSGEVIKLRDWDLVIAAPVLSAIECDCRTLIEAEEDTFVVGRIEPGHVRIFTAGRAFESAERLAAIGRPINSRGNCVDNIRVL